VGYPEKTNGAFAHGNKIWLGRGDDKEFKLLAQDPSVVLHELGHVIINQLSRLPTQGEGGSLNEGFADYLAATQIESSKIGSAAYLPAPFMRNLDNAVLFTQKTGGLYHDSLIVSGTLWTLRTKLGAKVVDQLAIKTLTRLGPSKQLSDFSYAITLAAENRLNAEQLVILKDVLKARQWPD
jgi:Zn-dependent metalloprotease